jgi:hypothetical protein
MMLSHAARLAVPRALLSSSLVPMASRWQCATTTPATSSASWSPRAAPTTAAAVPALARTFAMQAPPVEMSPQADSAAMNDTPAALLQQLHLYAATLRYVLAPSRPGRANPRSLFVAHTHARRSPVCIRRHSRKGETVTHTTSPSPLRTIRLSPISSIHTHTAHNSAALRKMRQDKRGAWKVDPALKATIFKKIVDTRKWADEAAKGGSVDKAAIVSKRVELDDVWKPICRGVMEVTGTIDGTPHFVYVTQSRDMYRPGRSINLHFKCRTTGRHGK